MFSIGWAELFVIAVIALVVVGPKDLPAMLRNLGRGIGTMRRMAADFQNQFNQAIREAELDGIAREIDSVRTGAQTVANPVKLEPPKPVAKLDRPAEQEQALPVMADPVLPAPQPEKPAPKAARKKAAAKPASAKPAKASPAQAVDAPAPKPRRSRAKSGPST